MNIKMISLSGVLLIAGIFSSASGSAGRRGESAEPGSSSSLTCSGGICRLKRPDRESIKTRGDCLLGLAAPDFIVYDLRGKSHHLSDYRGKVVLLDFWATTCGPCRKMTPDLRRIHKRFAGDGFIMLGLSRDRESKALQRYMRKNDIPWPMIWLGREKVLRRKYDISMLPLTVLIDREGIVRYVRLKGEKLEQAIGRLLSGYSSADRCLSR